MRLTPSDWIIVGLGNPGPRYESTRHNIGFQVIDQLATVNDITGKVQGSAWTGEGRIGDSRVILIKPLTFMNLSGEVVGPVLGTTKMAPDRLVVIHDEIDLESGDVRTKFGGGLAGHNGLKSITDKTGSRDYHRIRVGVGRPGPGDRRSVSEWVLSPFGPDDHVAAMIDDACEAISGILRM